MLEAAANGAKWTPRVAASQRSNARVVTGRGIAVGTHHLPQNQGNRVTYAAAVVDIETAIIGSGVRRSKLLLPGRVLAELPGAEVVADLGL